MIELRSVSKTYHIGPNTNDIKAVDDVSFALGDTGMVFILGKSGGGKSTLLNLLGGLDSPSSGEILVEGSPISSLGKSGLDSYRNTYVGFVFQDYKLLEERSVFDNVSLALGLQGGKSLGRVSGCLSEVGMAGFEEKKCFALSGGQKQRVALARALVKEPKLILADEPTGALDSVTGTQIMELLKSLSKDRLVVVVSHDRSFAEKFADRIIEIADGQIVSDSKKEETNDIPSKPLSLRKSRLRFGSSFLMASRSLGSKASRLIATVILSVSAFSMFGAARAVLNIDEAKAISSSVSGSKNKEVYVNSQAAYKLILKETGDKAEERFKDKVFFKDVYWDNSSYGSTNIKVVDKGPANSTAKQSPFKKVYDTLSINSFVSLDEDDLARSGFSLEGRLPQQEGEIAISKVLYDGLSRRVGLSTFAGLVVSIASLEKQTVVGVIDNHFDSEKYDGLRNSDLEQDQKLKNRLESDLMNSFSSTAYLSKEVYDENYSKSYCDIEINQRKDDGFYPTRVFDINKTCDSVEQLFTDYKNSLKKSFCFTNALYDYDEASEKICVGNDWFDNNGYSTEYGDFSEKEIIKSITLTDSDGEYVVTYVRYPGTKIFVRTSEKDDPRISKAENVEIETMDKKGFLEAYFVVPNGHSVHELLKGGDEFISLEDDEAIMSIDDYQNGLDWFKQGNDKADCTNNGCELGINRIKALFHNPSYNGMIGEELTFSKSLVTSEKTYEYLKLNSEGYHGFKAVLTNDESVNEDFIRFFMDVNPNLVHHFSTSYVKSVTNYFNFPKDVIYSALVIVLAVISSLVLMNFIGISMSYGKKEMGILRALGARNKDILSVYLLEALLIALINGVLSVAGSLLACLLINLSVSLSLGFFISLVSLSFIEPIAIFGLSVLVSLVGVAFPVWKNRNLKPIDMVRD